MSKKVSGSSVSGWTRARRRVQKHFVGESMTKQSFKAQTDVNNILEKYRATGILPYGPRGVPTYGDFSEVPSYSEAIQKVRDIDFLFSQLGARVREKFMNDPARFIDYMSQNPSREDLASLGLVAVSEPPATPSPASPVSTEGGKADEGDKGRVTT